MNSISFLLCLVLCIGIVAATTIHSIQQEQSQIAEQLANTAANPTICEAVQQLTGFDLNKIFARDSYDVKVLSSVPGNYKAAFCKTVAPCNQTTKPSTNAASLCLDRNHSLGSTVLPVDKNTSISWIVDSDHSRGFLVSIQNGDDDCAIPPWSKVVPHLDYIFQCDGTESFIITEMERCSFTLVVKSPSFCV